SDPPAIDLEFRFTGAARADAAAEPRQVRTYADEVRLAISQLRQFDLQLPFATARVTREDVENEHRPIDDRQGNDALEILALARSQIVEHQQQARVEFASAFGDFARLSAADQRRRIDRVAPLDDAIGNARAGRFGKRFELEQLRLER